mgnify:CR=1 FL=1
MYLRLIAIQLRSQMQYRASFWLELISTGLLNGSIFLSLALILERFGNIGGWTLGEIAFLVGMIEMSFGCMDMIFSGFDPDHFSVWMRQGTFDQVMLRPINLFWQVLGSRFLLRRLGRILQGVVIFGMALTMVDIQWTIIKLLYLPVVLISQLITMGALFMMGSTITFWTIQSIEAVNVLTYGGTDMMSYPMHIYPAWLRSFYTYIIPFIFLNYYPALYLFGKPDPLHFPAFAPFLAPLVAAIFLTAALWFWRVGVRHYQGAGS